MNWSRPSYIPEAPSWPQNGTKIAIVIATDGMPSDREGYSHASMRQELVDALRSMEGLPVEIVVRLFTDEEDVEDSYFHFCISTMAAAAAASSHHLPFCCWRLPRIFCISSSAAALIAAAGDRRIRTSR